MFTLWDGRAPFPPAEELPTAPGAEYTLVHEASADGYRFLLGAAAVRHRGLLRVCYASSFREENDRRTYLAERVSADGGRTWRDGTVAENRDGYGRSHGVYFPRGDALYVFCPRARYDRIDRYPDLKTEGYALNAAGGYDPLGVVLDADFWPMCEPIALPDGSLLMAGLETDRAQAAVALCDGADLSRWTMTVLPNPRGFSYWGETTVLPLPDRLVAIVRGGGGRFALASESFDGGHTWSGLEETDLPVSQSKMYAGRLSSGLCYLVFNMAGRGYRDTLAIAVGRARFERVFLLRDGFDAPPKFRTQTEWCYPYAYEDPEQGLLRVVYAKNKEDCEMVSLPVGLLSEG